MELWLNALQLRILRSLCSTPYAQIKELAEHVGRSLTRVSLALKELGDKGLVEVQKGGISKQVAISGNKHSTLLKTFISEHQHMKLEEILSGPVLEILLPLAYSKMKLSEMVEKSGYSERTVRRVMKRLKEYGIVATENFYYSGASAFGLLYEFVKEFQHYLNLKKVLGFSADAVILWERGKEFILKTERDIEESENLFSTCFAKMHDYGIKLMLPIHRYYFYTPYKKQLGAEDVVLHTLVVDKMSTRNILYVLLLVTKNWEKVDFDYLKKESEKFQLEEMVDQLFGYLKSRGKLKPTYFPSWEEFKLKAEEYGVWLKGESLERSM
ncbi:MAG: winged helix-turn-helix transcriptional regulator [Candidatus Bathyarchaeia archaeon]